MKLYQKTILITFILISVGFNIKHIFWPYDFKTQAEMINVSVKTWDFSEESFDKICNRIINNFKSDKDFIEMFKLNINEYKKYQLIARDTILPAYKNSYTAYGTNYPIYSNSYLEELNENKIKEYRRTVELYCLYNDTYQPAGACSEETIDNLFK